MRMNKLIKYICFNESAIILLEDCNINKNIIKYCKLKKFT